MGSYQLKEFPHYIYALFLRRYLLNREFLWSQNCNKKGINARIR